MTEKLALKDWVIGGVIGGVAGFAAGFLLKGPVTEWKQRNGIDIAHRIHHSDIGGTIAVLGAMTSSQASPVGPYITGFGMGLASEDWADQLGYRVGKQPEVYGSETLTIPGEQQSTAWKLIPDWPPRARYAAMCDAIRNLVYEDTNDPIVRGTAENIIKQIGADGRDYDAILMAFQLWILDNITYVHDPSVGPDGKPTDRYAHAYITLPASTTNPKGRGVGDCDDLVITFLSMAKSVGIDGVCGVLVDQSGHGYSHIMAGYCPTGRPKDIKDVTCIELTQEKPYGWCPPAKKYGFLLL